MIVDFSQLVSRCNWLSVGSSVNSSYFQSQIMKRVILTWFFNQVLAQCGDDVVWCDGIKQCLDGRDETGCKNYECLNPLVCTFLFEFLTKVIRNFIVELKKSA